MWDVFATTGFSVHLRYAQGWTIREAVWLPVADDMTFDLGAVFFVMTWVCLKKVSIMVF